MELTDAKKSIFKNLLGPSLAASPYNAYQFTFSLVHNVLPQLSSDFNLLVSNQQKGGGEEGGTAATVHCLQKVRGN